MKYLALALAALALQAAAPAFAQDPKATIADLDARLAKIGAPKVDGTETVAGKTVPALYFGDRKINNNYDVVDAVRKARATRTAAPSTCSALPSTLATTPSRRATRSSASATSATRSERRIARVGRSNRRDK